MSIKIVPVPEKNYEGRQWGYRILKDGEPLFTCSTGGTGACWNLGEPPEHYVDGDPGEALHICDLDDAIAALTALRDSEAHKQNVERWQ